MATEAALLHPGPLIADQNVEVSVEPGAAAALDEAADAAGEIHAFLRAAWYRSTAQFTLIGRRAGSGEVIAALPLACRRLGPLALAEVAGSYWPYRCFPVRTDAGVDELAGLLGSPVARKALGRAWRLGPVYANDPLLPLLSEAAERAGWNRLERSLGTCFDIDLRALGAAGPWPGAKALAKIGRKTRRLAQLGSLEFQVVGAGDWQAETFDQLARIESESWLAARARPQDLKFLSSNRQGWEAAVADPAIARRLRAALLLVGGDPAAFVFTLDAGPIRHIVANSFSERFRAGGPGILKLYREFEQARDEGFEKIGWCAGDAGYKSEAGATPGAEILDLLFVRGAVPAALARLAWR
ncbi:MAG: GNAT family N-acetyltransferase [Sphingosinicella sp.]